MRTAGELGEPNPRRSTLPESGVSKPVAIAMAVDLPAPLGPSNPNTSPAPTSNESPSTATTAPKDFRMSRSASMDSQGNTRAIH